MRYVDDVTVAAHIYVLKSGDTHINPVIYAHTNTAAIYFNGAAGGIAPYDGAVSGGVTDVIESVGTAVHNTLNKCPTDSAELRGDPNTARAVHDNISCALTR